MTTDAAPEPGALWARSLQTWFEGWGAFFGIAPGGDGPPPDPFRLWRRSLDQWIEGWALFFEDTLSRPEAAAASGRFLDMWLNFERPMREQTATTMQYWLEFLNMPTRREQIRTAKQLNDVNARLDELQEQMEELTDQLADGRDRARPVRATAGGGR